MISIDDLNAEYEKLSKRSGSNGLTTFEISEITSWAPVKVRRFVKLGIAAGTISATKKLITTIDGTMRYVPSYIIKGATDGSRPKGKRSS